MNHNTQTDRKNQESRLLDRDFLCRIFDQNFDAYEEIIKILLNKNIKIVRAYTPKKANTFFGPALTLDVIVEDIDDNFSKAEKIDEFSTNAKFKNLQKRYSIILLEDDYFDLNEPRYYIDYFFSTDRDVETIIEKADDSSSIVLVNEKYRGNDPINDLIHDLNCNSPEEMKISFLKEIRCNVNTDEQECSKKANLFDELRFKNEVIGIAKGVKKGIAKGIEQGIAEGFEKGIAKGKAKERKRTVKAIKKGIKNGTLNFDKVKNTFGLSADEIDYVLSD